MNPNSSTYQSSMGRLARLALTASLLAVFLVPSGSVRPALASTQVDIPGPAGSGSFGQEVKVLPNGNFVVTDPRYDAGPIVDVGAVYLYNGATGTLISALTGSTAGDMIGSDGVDVLSSGNYVVRSHFWDNSAATDAGAVTWGSSATGVNGVVSAANSLVGSTANDWVGSDPLTLLSNGNFVVVSPYWNSGSAERTGAATWVNGATGRSGLISAANSLVGTQAYDEVGGGGVTPLSNGNYVVRSPYWNNVSITSAGAATWGNGTTGISGPVTAANSLVGTHTDDQVGDFVTALSNGNYVVESPFWNNSAVIAAGAVTWGNGTTGLIGAVSAANSLVGSTAYDRVGFGCGGEPGNNGSYVKLDPHWSNRAAVEAGAGTWLNGAAGRTGTVSAVNGPAGPMAGNQAFGGGVTPLSNGNYVVSSSCWSNGGLAEAGAATWGNGTTGVVGTVSTANSLVGSKAGDQVGYYVTALSNGNYVVVSPSWINGAAAGAGAVTWANGATGRTGTVSVANSLVGSHPGDQIGLDTVALTNGNYVTASVYWSSDTAAFAGAVTWGNGSTGRNGTVSAENSLVGLWANDLVGLNLATLPTGNYVVLSPLWRNGDSAEAGAATWGNGTVGISGPVSAANSLVGSQAGDRVGEQAAVLANSNYVVVSAGWTNGDVPYAGAVTWANGKTGLTGTVSAANSLVGSSADDQVGNDGVTPLSNGNYVIKSPYWSNGPLAGVGAATWGNGATGLTGPVSAANSLVGSQPNDYVSRYGVTPLSNGNYVVMSPDWNNDTTADAGAITLAAGSACAGAPTTGPITAANSVRGTAANGGYQMRFDYDAVHHQLVVGQVAENMVSLFSVDERSCLAYIPVIKK